MQKPKRVIYRGVETIEGWPKKIIEAQQMPSLSLDGKPISRIRYGDEQADWAAEAQACGDCGVMKGEFHVLSCDVEECPACGRRLITCDCGFAEVEKEF